MEIIAGRQSDPQKRPETVHRKRCCAWRRKWNPWYWSGCSGDWIYLRVWYFRCTRLQRYRCYDNYKSSIINFRTYSVSFHRTSGTFTFRREKETRSGFVPMGIPLKFTSPFTGNPQLGNMDQRRLWMFSTIIFCWGNSSSQQN